MEDNRIIMKKKVIMLLLLIIITFTVSAQNIYFDIGAGIGWGRTNIDGNNVAEYFSDEITHSIFGLGRGFHNIFSVGLRTGYKFFDHIPLYFTGELMMVNNDFDGEDDTNSDFGTFLSFLVGPGVVYYPIPLIQLVFHPIQNSK